MRGIHWRTAAISPTIEALSQAGWELRGVGNEGSSTGAEGFWADWGRELFGGDVGEQVGKIVQQFDGSHLEINGLIRGGTNTTDEEIADLFAPLEEMELLRSSVRGAGSYQKVAATHRSRQAYRVSLPAQPEGILEYYLWRTERESAGRLQLPKSTTHVSMWMTTRSSPHR